MVHREDRNPKGMREAAEPSPEPTSGPAPLIALRGVSRRYDDGAITAL